MKKIIFNLTLLITVTLISDVYTYNPEHLRIFYSRGPEIYWDKWRKNNPHIKPDLSDAVIERASFSRNFTYVNLKRAKIIGIETTITNFSYSDISYAIIKEFKMPVWIERGTKNFVCRQTSFYKAKIQNSVFFNAEFINVNFSEAEIINTKFDMSTFKKVNFIKAKIKNSQFVNNFQDVDFSNSKIIESRIHSFPFEQLKILNAKFNYSRIYNCNISGWLHNVSFSNAELTRSSFYYYDTIMTNVDFTNANLTNVNFQKAKFNNVIFKNADMTGAKLERKWFDYVKKQGVRNFDKINWQ